ncbi:MAG: transcriptional regulator, partial [Phenylobacterium zucineum]
MEQSQVIHPVDLHVGARLRLARKNKGFSQSQLAHGLGLTFQQVQKYERGVNRISASKLYDAAGVLGVPAEWFFAALPAPGEGGEVAPDLAGPMLATAAGVTLARAFPKLSPNK